MVIYLHGFASGVTSSKAMYLGQRLRARAVDVQTPDLNLPDFSTLTVTRMLGQATALIDAAAESVTIIGSSLGGFVAVNAAVQRADRVKVLVLMAPALDFGGSRMRTLGETGIAEWKAAGSLDVFHYGYGRIIPVHYELYEDARRYDAFNAEVKMPVLVFQGRHDDTVDPQMVEEWCGRRPNVELHMLDDGHQLTASLPYIWERIEGFLKM